MARPLFAGIEEIILQRWRVKVTSSQFRFRSPQYLAFPCSSQCRGYQLKLAAPGQDKKHRTRPPQQRGGTGGIVTGLKVQSHIASAAALIQALGQVTT